MAKKEKVEIIQCKDCRYYNPISDTLEGVCRVSPFKAYRKCSQSCDNAVRREKR